MTARQGDLYSKLVPPQARRSLQRRLKGANTRYVDKKGAAPEGERAREAALRAEYAEEVARLSRLLGRDLSPWTRGEMV